MRILLLLLFLSVAGCATGPTEITGERWQGEIISFKNCSEEGEPWFNKTPHKIKAGVTKNSIMFTLARDEFSQVSSGSLNPDGSFLFWHRIIAPDSIYGKRVSTAGFRRATKIEGQVKNGQITGQLFMHHPGTIPGCGGEFILHKIS